MNNANIKLLYLELLKNLSTKLYEDALKLDNETSLYESNFQSMVDKIELVLLNIKNHKMIEDYMISVKLEQDYSDDIPF